MAKATKKENKTMWEKWGIRLSVIVGGLTAISLALGIPKQIMEYVNPSQATTVEEVATVPVQQTLAGTIYDSEDHQPLAGVRVSLPAYPSATTQTSSVGRFELHVTAPTETEVELIAQKDGYIADPRYAPLGDQGYNFTMRRKP